MSLQVDQNGWLSVCEARLIIIASQSERDRGPSVHASQAKCHVAKRLVLIVQYYQVQVVFFLSCNHFKILAVASQLSPKLSLSLSRSLSIQESFHESLGEAGQVKSESYCEPSDL